ncbi:hypothetical protein [Thiomonas sp.]
MVVDPQSLSPTARQFLELAGDDGVPCRTLRRRCGHGRPAPSILGAVFGSPDDFSFFIAFLRRRGFAARVDSRHAWRRHLVFSPDAVVGAEDGVGAEDASGVAS